MKRFLLVGAVASGALFGVGFMSLEACFFFASSASLAKRSWRSLAAFDCRHIYRAASLC